MRPRGSPKTGGRKKGIPNKRTLLLREALDSFGCDVPQRIVALLPDLSAEKQADILVELLKYLYPTRKAVEHSGPQGGPIVLEEQRKYMLRVLAESDLLAAAQTIAERLAADDSEED
jgi:hypothetical protein